MTTAEFVLLNGDQAGLRFEVTPGSYRILRRSAENFDLRSTLVSSHVEQWRLGQEDQDLINVSLSQRPGRTPEQVAGIDAYTRADDVAICDSRMSQPHAIILCDQDSVQIVDMGSRNGTFLNGARVGSTLLSDSDLLRCGTSRMTTHLIP